MRLGPSTVSNEYQSSPQRGFQAPEVVSEGEEAEEEEVVEEGGEEEEEEQEEEEQEQEQEQEEQEEKEEYLDEEQDGYGDQDGSADENAEPMEDDDAYEEDEDMDDYQSDMPGTKSNRNRFDQRSDSDSDLVLGTPDALRESRLLSLQELRFSTQPEPSVYGKIAKDLYSQMPIPPVEESDELVLNTEMIITKLYDDDDGLVDNEDNLHRALLLMPGDLAQLWAVYNRNTMVLDSEEYTTAIGPGPRASNFAKANFLAGLTLQIHHAPLANSNSFQQKVKPLPQILLEWIDEYHDPYPSQMEEVQAHRPSPANHHLFWDTILNGLLRGKVAAVVKIIKNAGWKNARSEMDDPRVQSSQTGYSGVALANVEKVVGAAIQVLSQCPAVTGDWDIRNSYWTLFRLRLSQAFEDLKKFAEGRDSNYDESIGFEADNFGKSSRASRAGTHSQIAKKAESRVPWHIYQRLVTLYSLVLGETDAIIENAQDWCEATVGLLVWWDEGRNERRLALGRSRAGRDSDADAYLRKLRRSFTSATAESTDFQVNTVDPVEVALASLLEGDNEAVIGFLRSWSGPISSAVAEVASLAGWLPHTESQNLISMGSLDQDDLDLLGINSSPSKADCVKDQTLIAYARSLAERSPLSSNGVTREGWELAIALLGRLDSTARSEEMIASFLERFDLDSSATVDKLWILLNHIGMSRHAENAAEVRELCLPFMIWLILVSHMPKALQKIHTNTAKRYGIMP